MLTHVSLLLTMVAFQGGFVGKGVMLGLAYARVGKLCFKATAYPYAFSSCDG